MRRDELGEYHRLVQELSHDPEHDLHDEGTAATDCAAVGPGTNFAVPAPSYRELTLVLITQLLL